MIAHRLHQLLAGVSRLTPLPDRVILALHETPSETALITMLDTLDEMGFTFRSVEDIAVGADGCALTFDDGDRSILDIAAPVLSRRGIPASAFVVTDLIGTTTPFWWVEVEARAGTHAPDLIGRMKQVPDARRLELLDELRAQTPDVLVEQRNLEPQELLDLEQAGVTVGNHSATHPLLDRCPDQKITSELRTAHERLSELLGHDPSQIAYPNGNEDHRVINAARDLGYEIGLLFDHRPVRRIDDPLRVSRIRLDVEADTTRIRSHSSGLHPEVHRLRNLWSAGDA